MANPKPVSVAPFASPAPSAVAPVPPAPVAETPPASPMRVLSEQDSYILTRIASQPPMDEVLTTVTPVDGERHRFSLPDELEGFAYDCSHGKSCKAHPWQYDEARGRWSYGKHGSFVFRWAWKNKLALDRNVSVRGWLIVNQAYFPTVSRYLFSANGAIEVGDCLLLFMPVKRALAMRQEPGDRSRELIKSRMTRVKDGVLMTGSPDDPAVYMPKGAGTNETDETEATVPGLMEGRDF